jgi:hypothetical protein
MTTTIIMLFSLAEECQLKVGLPPTARDVYLNSMECLKEVLEVCDLWYKAQILEGFSNPTITANGA